MVVALSIIGTLCILWGIVRGFFSILGDDMTQLMVSVFFAVLGVVCIGFAIVGY